MNKYKVYLAGSKKQVIVAHRNKSMDDFNLDLKTIQLLLETHTLSKIISDFNLHDIKLVNNDGSLNYDGLVQFLAKVMSLVFDYQILGAYSFNNFEPYAVDPSLSIDLAKNLSVN